MFEFCFVFRIGFRTSLLDFASRIERLHVCYNCADVWIVLAHFCSECSRARPSTGRSGQVIQFCRSFCDAIVGPSAVRAQPLLRRCDWTASSAPHKNIRTQLNSTVAVAAPARLRLVARCALVRNSLHTSCLQWDMTRYHTLNTMLEIGARK